MPRTYISQLDYIKERALAEGIVPNVESVLADLEECERVTTVPPWERLATERDTLRWRNERRLFRKYWGFREYFPVSSPEDKYESKLRWMSEKIMKEVGLTFEEFNSVWENVKTIESGPFASIAHKKYCWEKALWHHYYGKSITFPGEDPSSANHHEGLAQAHQQPSEDDVLIQQIVSITALIEKHHTQCIQVESVCGSPPTTQHCDNIATEPQLRAPEESPDIEAISAEEFAGTVQTRSDVRKTILPSVEQPQKGSTAEQKAKHSPIIQQILAPKIAIPGLFLVAQCQEPINQPSPARAKEQSKPSQVREPTMSMAETYIRTGAEPDKLSNPYWWKGLPHIPGHIPGWWAPRVVKQETSSRAISQPQLSPNPQCNWLAIDREATIELPYIPNKQRNSKMGNFVTPIPVIAIESPRAPHVAARGTFLESIARDYINLGPLSRALDCRLQMQLLGTDEGLPLMRIRVMPKDDKTRMMSRRQTRQACLWVTGLVCRQSISGERSET